MNSKNNSQLSLVRREILSTFQRELGTQPVSVAVLDYPDHLNAGDMLIWHAQRKLLRQLGHRIRYVASRSTYNEADLRRYLPNGVVLLHGGGNFGDLWPEMQRFREHIFSTLIDYKIVQLPQSVHYEDPRNAQSTARVVQAHPNLTIMVRDDVSLSSATSLLPGARLILCPDSVLSLSFKSQGTKPHSRKPLAVLRQDHEADHKYSPVRKELESRENWEIYDWGLPPLFRAAWKFLRIANRLVRSSLPGATRSLAMHLLGLAIRAQEAIVISNALHVFRDRPLVVTDRLHAHILATLRGVPNIVLDNSYGKIAAVGLPYTGNISIVAKARDIRQIDELSGVLTHGRGGLAE